MLPFIPQHEGLADFLVIAGIAGFLVRTGPTCVGAFPLPMGSLLGGSAASGCRFAPDSVTPRALEFIEGMKHFLHMVDAIPIVLELLVLLLYVMLQFCASNKYAKAIADRWVRGSWAFTFWGLMVTCGSRHPADLQRSRRYEPRWRHRLRSWRCSAVGCSAS